MARPTPLIVFMAETRRFELLKGLTPYLVSSEAHSTGLCDVSEYELSLASPELSFSLDLQASWRLLPQRLEY
jgi:hypothetical protein